tara:strand:+ start:311 stop:415 length:105 start_codon:yes stop_codon:yes gene_type:complete
MLVEEAVAVILLVVQLMLVELVVQVAVEQVELVQ